MEFILAVGTAFWLGVLTSISPCPMATNIAAISYISRNLSNPRAVFFTGLLYTIGRALAYLVIAILVVSSLLSAPLLSYNLQKYLNLALGPLLILVGMVLTGLISFNISGPVVSEKMQKRVESSGMWGAFVLGVIFALSFCPVSAALFFMSLIPLAVKFKSSVLLPSVYGIATGLPVLVFAVLIASGVNRVANAYNKLVPFERWARLITGIIFICVGLYYSLTIIFGIKL
jgi:cytochrome c-type biogenesis protein